MDYEYTYADKSRFWKLQDYRMSHMQETIELTIYSALAFLIPFTIGHPQIIVGIIVNAAIVLAALNMKDYRLLPVVMLPSIAVLARGIIFGPFTMYLIYMIPFIWLGNFILLGTMRELKIKRKVDSVVSLIAGAALKAGFLFGCAFALVKLGAIPAVFMTSMGIIQLYTALIGGALAIGIHEAKKKLHAKHIY